MPFMGRMLDRHGESNFKRRGIVPSSKPNLCIVALAYYPDYLGSLREAVKIISQVVNINAFALVLNNSRLTGSIFQGISDNFYCVSHDNTGAEFGGYQVGVDTIKRNFSGPFDLIIINDTVVSHSRLMKEHLKAFIRSMADDRPNRVVGQVDSSRSLQIDDLETSRWVRSNLLGFDHKALLALDYKIYQPYLNHYLNDSADTFFTDHIKASTREKISQWLFATEGHAWYGAAPLTEDNCTKMAAKARSIIQEFHLAMRLEQNKTLFVEPKLNLKERISLRIKKIIKPALPTKSDGGRVWVT
jgi:hypothetical protein